MILLILILIPTLIPIPILILVPILVLILDCPIHRCVTDLGAKSGRRLLIGTGSGSGSLADMPPRRRLAVRLPARFSSVLLS